MKLDDWGNKIKETEEYEKSEMSAGDFDEI